MIARTVAPIKVFFAFGRQVNGGATGKWVNGAAGLEGGSVAWMAAELQVLICGRNKRGQGGGGRGGGIKKDSANRQSAE